MVGHVSFHRLRSETKETLSLMMDGAESCRHTLMGGTCINYLVMPSDISNCVICKLFETIGGWEALIISSLDISVI